MPQHGLLCIALIAGLVLPPLHAQEPTIKPRPAAGRLPEPGSITARQVADGKVQVSWGSVPDAVQYRITRSVPPAPQTVLPPISDTLYLDQDVQIGKTYYYSIQAVDASGTAGLKAGPPPVTVAPADNGPRVALREIKPVTSLTVASFSERYVILNWMSSQGGVSYIVERAIMPNGAKGAIDWQTRTTTPPLPCCHWSVFDDGDDVRCGQVLYRVTAVDTASPSNRSTPTVSPGVSPCTTHHYQVMMPGQFWLPPQSGSILTLKVGGAANMGAEVGVPGHGLTSMDESIASVAPNGSVVGKAAGVTYVVAVNKLYDGSPQIIPYRVVVLP